MPHISRTKHPRLLACAIVACCMVLAFCLAGCGSSSSNQSTSSSSSTVQANDTKATSSNTQKTDTTEKTTETEKTTTKSKGFAVDTDLYSIKLDSNWSAIADVEYDSKGNAQVLYKDDATVVLFTCEVVSTSEDADEGDIGNAMVYSKNLGNKKRLEVWAPNYIYLFWLDATDENDESDYSKLTDGQKAEIIKITTGESINVSKLENISSESKLIKKYGTPTFSHMKSMVKQNLTVK